MRYLDYGFDDVVVALVLLNAIRQHSARYNASLSLSPFEKSLPFRRSDKYLYESLTDIFNNTICSVAVTPISACLLLWDWSVVNSVTVTVSVEALSARSKTKLDSYQAFSWGPYQLWSDFRLVVLIHSVLYSMSVSIDVGWLKQSFRANSRPCLSSYSWSTMHVCMYVLNSDLCLSTPLAFLPLERVKTISRHEVSRTGTVNGTTVADDLQHKFSSKSDLIGKSGCFAKKSGRQTCSSDRLLTQV